MNKCPYQLYHFCTPFLPAIWKKKWRQTCSWTCSSNSNAYTSQLPHPCPQRKSKAWTERWPSGLDEDVQLIRAKNKERILHALMQKIEHRKNRGFPLTTFEEGISYEEKYHLVSEWWNDFRFHLAMAVKSPTELNRFRQFPFCETMYLFSKARKKGNAFLRHALLSVTAELHRQQDTTMKLCAATSSIPRNWWKPTDKSVPGNVRT